MLAVALTLSLLAQGPAQAVDGPLGLVNGGADVSVWLGQPYEVSPGVQRVWWWQFVNPPSRSDGMNRHAFQFEVHCAANQIRQMRFELYADDRLLSGSDQSQPLHEPIPQWSDPHIMSRVCGGVQPQVTAPNAAAAAAHFRR